EAEVHPAVRGVEPDAPVGGLARLRHQLGVDVQHAARVRGEVVGEDVAGLEQIEQRVDHLRVVALLGVADVDHELDPGLARRAPRVAAPWLPASTMVVSPACTPGRWGWTPVRLTPSKMWAWRSSSPGVTSLSRTSMVRVASAGAISGAMRAMRAFWTAMSSTPS